MTEKDTKLCQLEGSVDTIIYRNEENGFVVLILDVASEPVTVVGELGNVDEGEELLLTGKYVNHKKFGPQFQASLCERSLPKSASAIQRYLASGAIKGIGPVLAKKIVSHFKDETLEILTKEPERIKEVDTISKKRLDALVNEMKNVFGIRALMIFLSKYNISPSYGVSIWKKYGKDAIDIIKSNPYCLCSFDIELPFSKSEELAESFDIPKNNLNRLIAGFNCILINNADSGHTCLPKDRLLSKASELLSEDIDSLTQVLHDCIKDSIFYSYTKKERDFIYLEDFYKADCFISGRIALMKKLLFDNKINFDDVIDIDEKQNNIKYDKLQRKAINVALSKGYLILTGGPGTGKTTTLNAIISLFEQQGLNVLIAAPTGRAAKRISDLTDYNASTIHRLLELVPCDGNKYRFAHNETNLLDADVIIIDEMSMVDTLLFEALLRAMPLSCKLIMVGDSDQLPSVGAGNVLRDLIESERIEVVKLTEIFRQAQKSCIVTNAHLIVKGEMPDLKRKDNDFFFIQRLSFDVVSTTICDLVTQRLPKAYGLSPIDDIQILSPTRKGPIGVVELNKMLQEEINPFSYELNEIKVNFYTFREKDKVMQIKNNYDIKWEKDNDSGTGIYNGDIGKILEIDTNTRVVKIDFDGRICFYNEAMLEDLELAYAITVHKSQGSEFNVVIIPILGGYDKLYFRNLLYTAVTRAKKMLIIVGSSNRVKYMVDNNRRTNRYTCLKDMIINECK